MKKLLLLAATALLLFACNKNDSAPENSSIQDAERTSVFHASTAVSPSAGTKVYADYRLRVLWNAGDNLTIFNKSTLNSKYAFTGNDGDTAGDFEFVSSQQSSSTSLANNYAIYPYSDNISINSTGTRITVTLPVVQHYKENSFGVGANTMVAVCDGDDSYLQFKNVCGYLKLRLWGDGVSVSSIELRGNNSEKIAGTAFITPVMDGDPSLEMAPASTTPITNMIILRCDTPVALGNSSDEATDFIFVVPPTTFSNGFKITVTDAEGKVFEKTTENSLTISRNTLETMGAIEVIPVSQNVVFEDPVFKAYCVENFDTDGDGEISFDEASVPLEIQVSDMGINSLKGIEYFTNINILECSVNELTSLDVSANTSLEYLSCSVNGLTSLDVSNNTALTYLDCLGNELTSLDVSNNTDLVSLYCSSNQLSSLDVTNNTELKILSLGGNQINSLDVTHNTLLQRLYMNNNQVSSLDLTNNTDLYYLSCNSNQLSSLNLTTNTKLIELEFSNNQLTAIDLDNNTKLKRIVCSNNNLASLTIDNFPDLTYLDCSNNSNMTLLQCSDCKLSTLKVSGLTNLITLECASNELQSLDVTTLTSLERLSSGWNQISSIDLSNNTNLKTLLIHRNQLSSLDLDANTALQWLRCGSNNLSSLVINNHSHLRYLDCQENPNMTYLECQRDSLTTVSIVNNTSLQYLLVPNNHISYIQGLNTCTALVYINCAINELTSSNFDISALTALTQLTISNNQLTSLEVSANTELQELVCYSNQITSLILTANRKLQRLWAYNNQLSTLNLGYLMDQANLVDLKVYNNNLSTLNVSKLTGLQVLFCDNNQLTSLNVVNNSSLAYLAAWATTATGSISTLTKALGQTITYLGADHQTVINPEGEPWNTAIWEQGSL